MVDVAVCDACYHRDYSDYHGNFFDSNGYTLTIVEHRTGTQHQAVACKETHIGKAARAALEVWRAEGNRPPRDDSSSTLVAPPVDAPPLPVNDNHDTQAVTQ